MVCLLDFCICEIGDSLKWFSFLVLRLIQLEMEVESSKIDIISTSSRNDVDVSILENEEGKSSLVKVQTTLKYLTRSLLRI